VSKYINARKSHYTASLSWRGLHTLLGPKSDYPVLKWPCYAIQSSVFNSEGWQQSISRTHCLNGGFATFAGFTDRVVNKVSEPQIFTDWCSVSLHTDSLTVTSLNVEKCYSYRAPSRRRTRCCFGDLVCMFLCQQRYHNFKRLKLLALIVELLSN